MELLAKNGVPLVAAHRGVSGGNVPCNSIAAFKAALAQGADVVELDVSVSRDGKLFCFHPGMEPAHLNRRRFIRLHKAAEVEGYRFVNQDDTPTVERVAYLADVFDCLRGKCLINVDKFWTAPEAITNCIREHGVAEQVIIKTGFHETDLAAVERYAPDLAYMPVLKRSGLREMEALAKRKLNLAGAEVCFRDDGDEVVSDGFIRQLHERGLALWGNAIVYNYKDVIGGEHTDDVAVTGDPDKGWGWYADRGFDIVQTDWCLAAKQYFLTRQTNPRE